MKNDELIITLSQTIVQTGANKQLESDLLVAQYQSYSKPKPSSNSRTALDPSGKSTLTYRAAHWTIPQT